MIYVTRSDQNFFSISENRCIELHSPDGIHSCILRAVDPQEATSWFNALHSAIGKSTQKALLDANRALASMIGELKFIGWLSRRCGGEQVNLPNALLMCNHIIPYCHRYQLPLTPVKKLQNHSVYIAIIQTICFQLLPFVFHPHPATDNLRFVSAQTHLYPIL